MTFVLVLSPMLDGMACTLPHVLVGATLHLDMGP